MMKILILHRHLLIGGVEKVLSVYLNTLCHQGHQIDLLIHDDLGENNVFLKHIPPEVNISFVLDNPSVRRRQAAYQKRKRSLMCKFKYEILRIAHQIQYGVRLYKCISHTHYDLLIDFHESLDNIFRLPIKWPFPPAVKWVHGQLGGGVITPKITRKYKQLFSKYQSIISICDEMAAQLRQYFPSLNPALFHTLYNPIDVNEIQQKSTQVLPETFRFPYILQVSRLAQGKGHEELIDIFAGLKQRGIPHKLLIIGEGDNRACLEQKIAALKLETECLLPGAKDNPYPYFKHAAVFVHTSEHEGLPTVLLESMACGTPVVAMDCPTGPKDILGADSRYGCLIPMHDTSAFADAVYSLLTDPEKHKHFSKQGLKRVQDFDAEKIARQLETILHTIAKQP